MRVPFFSVAAAIVAICVSPALAADRHVQIRNRTATEIMELYVTNTATDGWGRDVLGDDSIPPGETLDLNADDGSGACHYDLKVVFADGNTWEKPDLNVCTVGALNIHD